LMRSATRQRPQEGLRDPRWPNRQDAHRAANVAWAKGFQPRSGTAGDCPDSP
jgi:hypothetical protein